MKRIKSAPANIAEMVNRRKPSLEKKPEKFILFIPLKKQEQSKQEQSKQPFVPLKNQKIIEKTFNSIMIDYINDKQIIFRSKSIYTDRPQYIPEDAELMAMKENIGVCNIITPHKINFMFTVLFEDYVTIPQFAEKLIGIILNKIFKRLKQFIENVRIN